MQTAALKPARRFRPAPITQPATPPAPVATTTEGLLANLDRQSQVLQLLAECAAEQAEQIRPTRLDAAIALALTAQSMADAKTATDRIAGMLRAEG